MLQTIRDRAQGIFAWVMLILIGVPFALWGIQNYLDTGKEQPAAVVGDREIFDREVSRAYEQSLANLVGLAEFDEKQLRRDALEKLIREEVIAQGAEEKNLAVSEDEVRGFIQMLPFFQTEGKFDKEKYKIMLSSQGMNSAEFVAQVQRSLLMEQYQRGILESAFATKDQIERLLRLKNQEREIEYTTIPLKKSNRSFSDAEIEAYYREHIPDFRNPEQIQVEYIAVLLEDIARQIQVTEEDLRNFYEEQKGGFTTEERRRVSHILIPLESADEEVGKAALAKAGEIRERLVRGEDFGKVAKETSGDPVSAQKEGDLGLVTKGGMEPNFVDAALALKQGEISEPVKTSFGYHIIKVTELTPARVKPFEEVRDELAGTYQRNQAENKFYELGQTLTEQSYEHPDSLEHAAKTLNLSVQHTGWFTRDTGEGIAAEAKVREAAFSEDVLNGRNSDPIELDDQKAIVLRMKEHREPSDRPLAEVREEIIAKMQSEESRRETRKQAEDLLTRVRQDGKSLAEVAKQTGLSVSRPPSLRRDTTQVPPALAAIVFKTARPPEGGAVPGRVELEGGEQIVFSLLSVKDGAPSSADAQEQKAARELLDRALGQREFSAFIAGLRAKADVRIKPES